MISRVRMHLSSLLVSLCLLAPLVIGAAYFPAPACAASTIAIYPAQQYQTIQGWGSSMAWWANWAGGLSDSQRNSLADMLFDPTQGIGLNMLRYNFGADGPGNVCHNSIAAGNAGVYTNIPSYEPTAGTYDWTQDANQRWVLQAAQNRGATIFEGFVNSPPAWMLTNSCTSGASNGAENLSSAHYADFASYITTIAQHFHDSWGLTLRTLEPFNEATSGWWTYNGTSEGSNISEATQNTIINLLGADLAQSGVSAYSQISASDGNAVSESNDDYNSYSSTAQAYVAQYNTHTYAGSDADQSSAYANIGQSANKRIEMSEWGDYPQSSQIAAALELSQHILDNEQYLHPSTWVIWQAVDSYANSQGSGNAGSPTDLWGLAATDSNGNLYYPTRYYAMGNYSKFVRPGYKMIGNSDSNTFTAYDAGSNTLVIVATNSSTSSNPVTYDLSNFTGAGTSATPYQTSASENLTQLSDIGISNGSFSSTLPAQSITTFVVHNVTYSGTNAVTEVDDSVQGTGLNQFNYTGNWGHCSGSACGDPQDLYNGSNSWSGQTGATASVQFNGSRIRLFGARGNDEGIATVSIDGGPATEVDFYAAQRVGNQLMWESPLLSAGTHTLTLTVTGRKNPQSSNVYPALDRVEIDPGASVGNGDYKLVNHNSGLLLADPGFDGTGTQQVQWNDDNGSNMHWTLTSVGNGLYEITCDANNLALDVSGSSAIIDAYTGSSSQLWSLQSVGNGYYNIVNSQSGELLAVSEGSTSPGGQIIQWTNDNGNEQQWQFQPV